MNDQLPKSPDQSKNNEIWLAEMRIDDAASMLFRILSAIEKWEEIAWNEFEAWKAKTEAKHPEGYEYHDPINDEGIMIIYTKYALYGSLSVNITSFVEDQLKSMLKKQEILKDGQNNKQAKKPHFFDYIYSIEQISDTKRCSIPYYKNHLFVRELANRFKHSGGKSTKDFIDKYQEETGIDRPDKDIPYNQFDWKSHIDQASELLKYCSHLIYLCRS